MPGQLSSSPGAPEQTRPSGFRVTSNAIATVCGVLSATAIVLMTAGITIDVVLRTLTGHGVTGVIEAVDPMLVCVAFLALSVTEMKGEHVALSLVTDRIVPRIRYILIAFGALLCIVFACVLAISGAMEAITSVSTNEVRAGVVRVPLWPARIAVVIGTLALLLQFILTFIDAVRSACARRASGVWVERESSLDVPAGL